MGDYDKRCPEGCKAPMDTWQNDIWKSNRLKWVRFWRCWTCGYKEEGPVTDVETSN